MGEFSYEIKENIAVLSEGRGGWSKELKKISWNGRPEKLDIRDWQVTEDGERKMSKGITLSQEEAVKLRDALNQVLGE